MSCSHWIVARAGDSGALSIQGAKEPLKSRRGANIQGGMLLRRSAKQWSLRRPKSQQLKRLGFRHSIGRDLLESGACDNSRFRISSPKEDRSQ
jgi:hypothetical protein